MHSLLPDYLAKRRFDVQKLASMRALGEHRGKQQVLSDLRQVAVMRSTELSTRLEGVVVAVHRLKSLVLKNATPQSRSEQEVAGYRDALGLIHESGEQMPFSESTVLQLHSIRIATCRSLAGTGKPPTSISSSVTPTAACAFVYGPWQRTLRPWR